MMTQRSTNARRWGPPATAFGFAALLMAVAHGPNVRAGSGLEEDWQPALAATLQKTEAYFSEVEASGTLKTTTRIKGLERIRSEERFQRSRGAFKYVRRAIEPKREVPETVFCRNPDRYLFELQRHEGQTAFAIKNILPKTTDTMERQDTIAGRFLLVSHSVQGVLLSRIMADRSFSVRSAARKGDEVTLVFDWSPSPETMTNLVFRSAKLWLSPSQGWAVTRYRVSIGPPGGKATLIDGRVEYDRTDGGVAIPKRVTETHGASGKVEFTFDQLEHRTSDAGDFTLSFYGLPEPPGVTPVVRGSSTWWLWFMGLGFAALAAGAYLFRRARRRQAGAAQAP